MQIQLDPGVPTRIPPQQLDDFKSFLDGVLETIIGSGAPPLLTAGDALWRGIALIVVVWTGLRIAFSGQFQPWELIRTFLGLWIPWVMLFFYDTNIPGTAFSFPGAVAAQGTWLQQFFLADTVSAMQTELSKLVDTAMKSIAQAWAQSSIWDLATSASHAAVSLIGGAVMLCFITLTMLLLFCVTYAQVIWAQLAVAILIFLGPIFIPWLVFDPLAFLFWGWFRSLIVYALYGAIAGAIMRVFAGVGIGYITTLATEAAGTDVNSLEAMGKWTVTILPLCVAGLLASLKVGDLASMLVSGSGSSGAGLMSAAMMAATGGKAAAAGAAMKK